MFLGALSALILLTTTPALVAQPSAAEIYRTATNNLIKGFNSTFNATRSSRTPSNGCRDYDSSLVHGYSQAELAERARLRAEEERLSRLAEQVRERAEAEWLAKQKIERDNQERILQANLQAAERRAWEKVQAAIEQTRQGISFRMQQLLQEQQKDAAANAAGGYLTKLFADSNGLLPGQDSFIQDRPVSYIEEGKLTEADKQEMKEVAADQKRVQNADAERRWQQLQAAKGIRETAREKFSAIGGTHPDLGGAPLSGAEIREGENRVKSGLQVAPATGKALDKVIKDYFLP